MLLGVIYHLPIAFLPGGFGIGFGFLVSPKTPIDHWLHSFRMPLFFLISGFFANMMLAKYGTARYLARRGWRIGAPLLIAIFAFAGLRIASTAFGPAGPPGFGPPAAPYTAPPAGPPAGFGAPGPSPFGVPAGGLGAPGATPFGMPPAGPGAPSPSPPGNVAGGGFSVPPLGVTGGVPRGPGSPTTGMPAFPAFFQPFELPRPPSRTLADRLFGKYSWCFNLEHLWFLWYLVVFATIAPLVATVLSRTPGERWPTRFDRLGSCLMRFNIMAIALGISTVPALIHARGFAGWSLANPVGFLAPFPDFLFQYYPDSPYYFVYFLAGWWLYRVRSRLSDLARCWLWNLVLGIAGFAASQALSDAYFFRPDAHYFDWIRLGSFALQSVGTAYTSCAFLGFFQRYLDRPTRMGRYFADTILWVYLVHLPLIPYLLWWIQPGRAPWWVDTLAGMIVVTGAALVLFELCVRPSPLVYVFGPPRPPGPRSEKPLGANAFPAALADDL